MAGARRVGAATGRLAGMINPDVWHELAYASVAGCGLLFPRREPIVDRGADDFPPLVLVHGLGANRGTWWPLRLFLMLNGHKRIYAFGYESGTVEDHGVQLKSFVDEVLRVTGETKVDIVAHSLGGLVARYAIQRLELAGAVRTLITLASPHHGTYTAQYANTAVTRALCPDSDLLRDLNTDDLSHLGIRFITVHSDRDVLIMPREAMTHPNADNLFVPGHSHTEQIFSLAIFRLVATYLPPARVEKLLTQADQRPDPV